MTNGFHKEKGTPEKPSAKKPETPKEPPANSREERSDAR